jgi:hypothetical protein
MKKSHRIRVIFQSLFINKYKIDRKIRSLLFIYFLLLKLIRATNLGLFSFNFSFH